MPWSCSWCCSCFLSSWFTADQTIPCPPSTENSISLAHVVLLAITSKKVFFLKKKIMSSITKIIQNKEWQSRHTGTQQKNSENIATSEMNKWNETQWCRQSPQCNLYHSINVCINLSTLLSCICCTSVDKNTQLTIRPNTDSIISLWVLQFTVITTEIYTGTRNSFFSWDHFTGPPEGALSIIKSLKSLNNSYRLINNYPS